MFRGIHTLPVQVVVIIRPVGMELSELQFFISGPFWSHKLKPKQNYKSNSNILHLLSTPDSVAHAEPVLASLVADSKSF